jgi:multidrug efflux pump subunit AcrA (membrane-fusion protein)
MFARGVIVLGTRPQATLVDKDAVLFGAEDDGGVLFVVGASSKAEQRKVKIGYTDTLRVEVLSGVSPGDRVIVAGQNALQDGDAVSVTDAAASGAR